MERWRIRPATDADQPELAAIYLETRRATFTWVAPERFQIGDFVAQSAGETILVCIAENGSIGGFIAFWPPDNFIHMLYIRSEFQGLGIGTALLKALPGWPKTGYRLKCLVKNARARMFYQSIGFIITGTGTSGEGDYNDMQLVPMFRPR
jgi:ribosomal protein S18 acetylase RimI-like enzyme